MGNHIITLLVSACGALLVAGLVAWIKKPRLAYLVPRLFTKSNISDHGQLAEVTVFNRGFGNEEDVVLSLNPKLRYEVVGSTSRDFVFFENKLSFPRIGSNNDITVVLTIEGGAFDQTDIESCLSKTTTGVGVDSLALVPSSGQSKVAGVVTFIAVPLVALLVFYGLERIFVPRDVMDSATAAVETARQDADAALGEANRALEAVRSQAPTRVHGWNVPWYASESQIFRDFQSGLLSLNLDGSAVERRGDIVVVPVVVKNSTSVAVRYSIKLTTPMSEREPIGKDLDSSAFDVFVAPSSVSARRLSVAIPHDSSDLVERSVWVEASFETIDGQRFELSRVLEINPL